MLSALVYTTPLAESTIIIIILVNISDVTHNAVSMQPLIVTAVVINHRRMREGYGIRFVCVSVTVLCRSLDSDRQRSISN